MVGDGPGEKQSAKKGEEKKRKLEEKIENWSGRFVKIPRTTYKLHHPIVAIVGRSETGANSKSFFRLSSLACKLASSLSPLRDLAGARRLPPEIQFAENALRGASRKPVESDKLVIEQGIFLSFSGRWLGRLPFVPRDSIARARGNDTVCPIYKKRRQLLRSPQRINIVYVSTRIGYRAWEFVVFLRFPAPRRLQSSRSSRYIG